MYILLKDELKVLQFIKKYLSQIEIMKPDDSDMSNYTDEYESFKHNHSLLSDNKVSKFNPQYDTMEVKEEAEVRMNRIKLSTVFSHQNNFEIIRKSLTCVNAKVRNFPI